MYNVCTMETFFRMLAVWFLSKLSKICTILLHLCLPSLCLHTSMFVLVLEPLGVF